jgi:23S rRNA (guanosine2251-2'-O)-methyltransferase
MASKADRPPKSAKPVKRTTQKSDPQFICGAQCVKEVLTHVPQHIIEVLIASEGRKKEFGALLHESKVRVRDIEKARLSTLLGTSSHQDIAAQVHPREYLSIDDFLGQQPDEDALVVLLDQVQDTHNVGAILRACEVYGVTAVGWPESGSASITASAAKVAVGASELLTLLDISNLARSLEMLKSAGFWVIAADERGEAAPANPDFLTSGKRVLVLGAEGAGLRRLTRDKADFLWSLQTFGRISSLNVSQAAAVCLHQMSSS